MRGLGLPLLLALTLALGIASSVSAQIHRTIEEIGPADLLKSERQRARADELALRHLGQPLRGGQLRNLEILQQLIDGHFISKGDVMDQQALGVVLGDVMADQLRLSWIVVDDQVGHSRALRWRETQPLFFPVTMISKRMSSGEKVSVRTLYQRVASDVQKLKASYR